MHIAINKETAIGQTGRILVLFTVLGVSGLPLCAQNSALFPIVSGLKTGFIDGNGKVVVEPQFDVTSSPLEAIGFSSELLYPVAKNLKWGYVDRLGAQKIPFQFSFAAPFSEGFASVRIESQEGGKHQSKYAYIDTSGHIAIPAKFDKAGKFSEGLAFVVIGSKIGYIDTSGSFAVALRPFHSYSEELSTFSEGLAALSRPRAAADGEDAPAVWGYVDRNGTWIIPPHYREVSAFHDGIAAVAELNETDYKFINHSGETVAGSYPLAWRFSEGLARVQTKGGTFAFIDTGGKLVFDLDRSVRWAEPFSEGLAAVEVRLDDGTDKTGYIDRSGKFVILPVYDRGSSFHGSLAYVSMCGQEGYIDAENRPVWGIKALEERKRSAVPSYDVLTPVRIAAIADIGGGVELLTSSKSDGTCSFFGRRYWSVVVKSVNMSFPEFSIDLVEGGTFLTEERIAMLKEMNAKSADSSSRPISQRGQTVGYITAFGGPGGAIYVASVFSPDRGFEIQMNLSISAGTPPLNDVPEGWAERVILGIRELLFGSE